MSTHKENNLDQFKAVTAAALRSLARRREVEPNFTAGEPPIGQINTFGKPRLPLPAFEMDAGSVRLVRGCSDAYALRMAEHDAKLHSRLSPMDAQAQAA
ncbi:MAG TPA: cobaltochelatase subunit CobT, partial [Alphaproteobacteria bacterium]|nr:cobaltochelatase subunit CobT [Alphaproteobacteria bacterium]